jgi:hypothetical protein
MDQQGANNLLKQSFDIWFQPEIERRKSAGILPTGFSVWAAQVIMELGAESPIIRLNGEVHSIFKMKATKPVTAGEIVDLNDFSSVEGMILGDEFPNAGHLTTLLHKNIWYIIFDFQYNAAHIETQLSSADQFLKVSRFSVESNLPIPAIDNLYDSVQLMAKCFLLTSPDKKVLEASSHGFIETNYNLQGKYGNVSTTSVELLNRLVQLRPKTRYAISPIQVSQSELVHLLECAQKMREEIEVARPKREKPPKPSAA